MPLYLHRQQGLPSKAGRGEGVKRPLEGRAEDYRLRVVRGADTETFTNIWSSRRRAMNAGSEHQFRYATKASQNLTQPSILLACCLVKLDVGSSQATSQS